MVNKTKIDKFLGQIYKFCKWWENLYHSIFNEKRKKVLYFMNHKSIVALNIWLLTLSKGWNLLVVFKNNEIF